MKLADAKILCSTLLHAIREAEDTGADEVVLLPHLQELDDQARAELQAAIDAAQAKG